MLPVNLKEVVNFSDVRKVEPYKLLNGIRGREVRGYGIKPGIVFTDEYGDERTANEDTVLFIRADKWFIRFIYDTDDAECEGETDDFEIIKKVCLAWATKKRHIAIDGNILCDTNHTTSGYSVKNGQYNTLSLSGLPTYKKVTNDSKFTHGDGFIDFLPLDKQPFFIDTKSICIKCQDKYKSCFIKKVSEASFNNPYQKAISKMFNTVTEIGIFKIFNNKP